MICNLFRHSSVLTWSINFFWRDMLVSFDGTCWSLLMWYLCWSLLMWYLGLLCHDMWSYSACVSLDVTSWSLLTWFLGLFCHDLFCLAAQVSCDIISRSLLTAYLGLFDFISRSLLTSYLGLFYLHIKVSFTIISKSL